MAARAPRNTGAPAQDATDQMAPPMQAQQPGYYPPPQQAPGAYYGDQGNNGLHDAAQAARRYVRTPETKEFYRTSEFLVWLLMTVGVLIAALVHDNFDATEAWPAAILLTSAYVLSRGIAKSGSRRGNPEPGFDGGRF